MADTVAAVTARALAHAGIERVFGLPGGEVLVLMDELRRAGVDFVLMRHEANAGIAAAVYGKLRRQPGVVLTTLGPGAANLMLPLGNAYLDQEPLLAISAQIPDEFPPSHTHQRLPLHDVYRPVTRLAGEITTRNADAIVKRALAACMERPYGTAYLTLSASEALRPVAGGDVDEQAAAIKGSRPAGIDALKASRALAERCAAARSPLVLIGLGVDPASSEKIRQWLAAWRLPVAVTPKVKGIVDETSSNFVGVVGGMAADGLMCDALRAADLLVGFGLDPVEIDKTWHAELPIVWVLEKPNVGGIVPPGTDLVDHGELLDAMLVQNLAGEWDEPFRDFQTKRHAMLRAMPPPNSGTMWPGDIVEALAEVAPPETIVTTDVGSHKYLFGQFWPSRQPETFWMSNGLSGMSYGLSAAIGAKFARPNVPVIAAVGDGGFSMNAQELETARRAGVPFVTIVLEDDSYSLIKLAQEGKQLPPYRTDFSRIDTVKMAEACGVNALRTSRRTELATAAATAIEGGDALVIAVPVDYTHYRRLF